MKLNVSRLNAWLLGLLTLGGVLAVLAATAPAAALSSVQDFYVQDTAAKQGMIMRLSAAAGIAEPADNQQPEAILGVLTAPSAEAKPGQVGVQTDGVADTLVSTLNGNIKVGDRVTASSLKGTGAKANGTGWIVGVAQGSLDASSKSALKSSVVDAKGQKHDVYVGTVPVLVKVTYYIKPPEPTKQSRWVPEGIQDIADTIAGKHASPLAILFSFALLLFGLVGATLIVTNAVRGGFQAIARQPLTKRLILRQVMMAFTVAIVMLGVMFGGSLLILRIL